MHAISDRQLVMEFIQYLRKNGRKEKTIESYQDVFNSICKFLGHSNGFRNLTGFDIRHWKSKMLEEGNAPNTINHRVGVIQHFANWAFRLKIIGESQALEIMNIPMVEQQRLGAVTLEAPALQRFLRYVELSQNKRDKALIHLLLSGLRVGEVAGLRFEDVSITTNKGNVVIRGEHVKRSSHRIVPLCRQARLYLLAYLNEERTSGAIFQGQRGDLTTSGIDKIIRKYGAAVGIQAHCHLMRHQFAENYLRANPGDLVGLQLLLGHASVDTTCRHYVRKRLFDLEVGVEKINI